MTAAGRFIGSSIGKKVVMALTGVALFGFVIAHMLGTLQVFLGPAALNAYALSLRHLGALLWAARIGLLVAAALHVWSAYSLTMMNRAARPQGYREKEYRESTYASRTMRVSGPFLAAFIVYHLLHMTTGTVHPHFEDGGVYQNLTTGLGVVPVALFYLAAMGALAFHLFHGIWSLFQTLGVGAPRYESAGRQVATLFTIVVAGGFAAVPLSILLGILR